MGIDADGLSAEGVAKKDVGGFSSDAGKGQEIVQLSRHLALKAADEFRAAVLDSPALDTIEVNPADIRAELLRRSRGIVFGMPILSKERGRNLIDEIVSGLSGHDEGNQEFQRVGKVEIELGVRVGAVELADDFLDPARVVSRPAFLWVRADHIVFAAEYDTSNGKMSKGGTGKWT